MGRTGGKKIWDGAAKYIALGGIDLFRLRKTVFDKNVFINPSGLRALGKKFKGGGLLVPGMPRKKVSPPPFVSSLRIQKLLNFSMKIPAVTLA